MCITDDFYVNIIRLMNVHNKTIWDAIYLLCKMVPDTEISHRQTGEILTCIVEKSRGSLASALVYALEEEGYGKESKA